MSAQPRSVFDVLKQSAASGTQQRKRKATSHIEAPASQRHAAPKIEQHSYGTCPICQRSIPSQFLQMHASTCNGSSATTTNTPEPQHLSVTVGSSDTTPQQNLANAAQAAGPLSKPLAQQAGPSPAGRANAFKILMNAQKSLSSKSHHTFFLELTDSGWRWHWWSHTAAKTGGQEQAAPGTNSRPTSQPVWSAEITLKEQQQLQQHFAPVATQQSGPSIPLNKVATQDGIPGASAPPPPPRDDPGAPDTQYGGDGDVGGGSQEGQQQGLEPAATSAQQAAAAAVEESDEPGSPLSSQGSPRAGHKRGATHTSIIHLQTNVHPGAGGAVDRQQGALPSNRLPPEGRWHGLPSGVKSALQKAIRRGNGPAAVRIALEMVKSSEGTSELLRRVPVISLEDTLMHPALPLVVWLMAAQSKGYTLGALHVTAVLHMVYSPATVQVRDYLSPLTMVPGSAVVHSLADADAVLPGKPQEAALLKSLLLRASFGGMPGDVSMLRGYATYWARRFQGSTAPPPQLPTAPQQQGPSASQPHAQAQIQTPGAQQGIEAKHSKESQPTGAAPLEPGQQAMTTSKTSWLGFIESAYAAGGPVPPECCLPSRVGPLTPLDIPLTAIDFHVSDISNHLMGVPEVQKALKAVTDRCWGAEADMENCIRQTIWLFRSSINSRPFVQLLPLPEAHDQLKGSRQSPGTVTVGSQSGSGRPHARSTPTHILREMERERLEGDLDRDASHRDRLQPLHEAVQKHADQYAANVINKHFQRHRSQPPGGR